MKSNRKKYIATLCASVLTLQLTITPISTHAFFDDDNLKSLLTEKVEDVGNSQELEQVKPSGNSLEGNNQTGEVDNGDKSEVPSPTPDGDKELDAEDDIDTPNPSLPSEPTIPLENLHFYEVGVIEDGFTTYSWSPEIPADYDNHWQLAEDMFEELKANPSNEKTIETAYAMVRLPLNFDVDKLNLKNMLIEEFLFHVEEQKNVELTNRVAEIIALVSYDYLLKYDYSQDYVLIVGALELMVDSPAKDNILDLKEEYDKTVKPNKPEDKPTGTPGTDGYEGEYENGETIDNDYVGGVKPEKPPVPTLPEADYDSTKVDYVQSGKSCLVLTHYYKDGKLIRQDTRTAKGVEASFCISKNADTPKKNPSQVKFNGYNPYDAKQRKALYKNLKEQDEEQEDEMVYGDLTIQYTFNKNNESPYYIDTGVAIPDTKEVTYEQARNALQIISIEAKGQYVEDVKQVLALVDGQIIRIEYYEGAVSFKEFEKNFELTNVGVKLQDTRSQTKQELIDLIEIKGVQTIEIDGQSIELTAKPIVDNNIVLFPAKQIVELLKGTIIEDDKKITVNIGGATIVYTNGLNKALLNGEEVDLTIPVRKNTENETMIPINTLLTQVDLEIKADGEVIKIVKIEE